MNKEELIQEGIQKEEAIGYLKSALNLQHGKFTLTPKRLHLEAHKTTVGGGGLLGAFLKKKVEAEQEIFNLEFSNIGSIAQGKHGVEKNVLEITDKQNNKHRIIVKNYTEWETLIKQKMS
jgi:hypothetical protein